MIDAKELRIGNLISFMYPFSSDDKNKMVGEVKRIGIPPEPKIFGSEDMSIKILVSYEIYCQKYDIIRNHSSYFPIFITEDLLKVTGFRKQVNKITNAIEYRLVINNYPIRVIKFSNTIGKDYNIHIDNCDMDTIRISDIQYLHQLQNEIYDATKQELNVSLVALDNGNIFNSCL